MNFNIKRFLLYGFIAVYVLFFVKYCVQPLVPSRLYFELDKAWGETSVDSCLYVNLPEVTSFDWDTMYYYERNFPVDSINKRHKENLGFMASTFNEGRLVFVKCGSVVYATELDVYVEETSRTLLFAADSVNWIMSREEACFKLCRLGSPFLLANIENGL